MKINVVKLNKARRYSDDFKREMVKLYENGSFSVCQLERLYGVGNPTLYNWIHKFSTFNKKGIRIVEMEDSSTNKLKALEKQVSDLERMVGSKQIMIEYLEKMIDLAKEHYNIDIPKNSNTPQSNGSKNIEPK